MAPAQSDTTCLAPAVSAPDRKGSTALIAVTRPAFSAAPMSGNGMATYFTLEGLTPAALSCTLVIRVWILLVRFTAMVLPARPPLW